jgi:hypothetical protein
MTSAGIGMKMPDGSIQAVRLNCDGYPGHAGVVLAGWYKTADRVKALLDLGELSFLGERFDSSDPGKGNLTIAYGRDGGEEAAFPVQNFPSTEEYHRIGLDQLSADYLYLYDNGRWLVFGLYNDPDWIEMQVIIGKEQ